MEIDRKQLYLLRLAKLSSFIPFYNFNHWSSLGEFSGIFLWKIKAEEGENDSQ